MHLIRTMSRGTEREEKKKGLYISKRICVIFVETKIDYCQYLLLILR